MTNDLSSPDCAAVHLAGVMSYAGTLQLKQVIQADKKTTLFIYLF